MDYIILAVSVLMDLLACGILRNSFCKNNVRNNADLQLFNAFSSIVSALCLLCIYIVNGSLCAPSMYTILLGIVFGAATALVAIFNMKALECGPLSYTKVIISGSMIIPSLSGLVLYGERVSVWQYIGIGLMLVSFILAVDTEKNGAKANIKWFVYCIIAFVFCGSIGIMQKIHQTSEHKNEIGSFLLIAFGISALISFILIPVFIRKERARITLFSSNKTFYIIVITLVCGAGIAFCNHYNMYLSGVIDSVILFPVLNGGSMILTTASGLIFWKEKLTKKQTAGLICGIVAILLLCNMRGNPRQHKKNSYKSGLC